MPTDPRAIFLMLDALEHQIRGIKSLLGPLTTAPQVQGVPAIRREDTYLDDDQDIELEKKMDQLRQAMIDEDERAVQTAFAVSPGN